MFLFISFILVILLEVYFREGRGELGPVYKQVG